jgi:hypothetical protein
MVNIHSPWEKLAAKLLRFGGCPAMVHCCCPWETLWPQSRIVFET